MRVLVTGGSSDIARSIVRRRLELGDEVVITASSAESLARCLEAYGQAGLRVRGLVFDLASPQASEAELAALAAEGLQALVLNAWTRRPPTHRFHELAHEAVASDIHANVLGNVWLLQRLLPGMAAARFGRIVFISSLSTAMGTGRYGSYVLGKSALEGLVRNLAVDYGEFNVLANTVRLGVFKTSRTRKYWSRASYVERMTGIIPQAALGEPEDFGPVMDPLLAQRQYINGAVLDVSGGMPMIRLEGVLR
jgi:NAD(P)-dependent dehydrogenase (short-subunit alcohol dehydrogenase family)